MQSSSAVPHNSLEVSPFAPPTFAALTATQSESTSTVPQSSLAFMPASLQDLQDRARAGFQATSQIVMEQVELTRQATHDRVNIARAGKKLLDEGGEVAAQVVLAKRASLDASDIDKNIATRVHVAIAKLDDSVAKLKIAQSAQHVEEQNAGNHDFCQLATEQAKRADACRRIAQMLETPASSASMSPEEFDAMIIVQAKMGCASMVSMTAEGLVSAKQKALTSMASVSAVQSADGEQAPEMSSRLPTLLQRLQPQTRSVIAIQNTVCDAANERIEAAKAGKRLLDNGGEIVAQVVVAKKACLDAADIEGDIAQRVQSAILLFDDSVAKLRAVKPGQTGESMRGDSKLAELADEHEARAKTYRQIAHMLEAALTSIEMDLSEWDALSLVKVRDSCTALQSRTNEGFEAGKGLIFSGCTTGIDHLDRKRKTVCA